MVVSFELRNDFGLAGEKFVKDRFHYQRLVIDTRKLYNQLLLIDSEKSS